ncbi:hypothetical protein BHM03_00037028 [Ensete ventricosum]|nr:hypothetical protein BHM03_00037028 [Ensete ventricosum]
MDKMMLSVRGPSATRRFRQKSAVGGRLSEKSTVGSRLRKKKGRRRGKEKKKKRGIKNTSPAPSSPACRRRPRVACAPSPPAGHLHVVTARGSPARGHCPRVTRGRFFSRARRRSISPREETD